MKYDICVIGGGPAGLAAALEAKRNGIEKVLILERDKELGGILQQCIHNGFGLHEFKEELTGPEYAQRFISDVKKEKIDIKLETMVLTITEDKKIHIVTPESGYTVIEAKAVVLAMGCRERTRGAISIPGDRPSGVLTAGAAQRYINMEGYMVGKEVVILGSGDIGLIMARRVTLEGAKVKAVAELMPYSGGLTRNIVQCLDDYNIPLLLNHTVTHIKGKERLQSVTIAEVDKNRKAIPGTEREYKCDTLLLSVGLIPENELSLSMGVDIDTKTNGPVVNEIMETNREGVFACGNVVHVHDLVDFVSEESRKAGKGAAKYVKNRISKSNSYISIKPKESITYTVPQKIRVENIESKLELFFRVNQVMQNRKVDICSGDRVIHSIKKRHLAPGEMEKIEIKKEIIEQVDSDEIFVSISKEVAS